MLFRIPDMSNSHEKITFRSKKESFTVVVLFFSCGDFCWLSLLCLLGEALPVSTHNISVCLCEDIRD